MRLILPILVLLTLSTQAFANSTCSAISDNGHANCSISCGSAQAICQRGTGGQAPTCSCAPNNSSASPEPQKSVPTAVDGFVEETNFLNVTIAGHVVRLEGLIVKAADGKGRLPVALLAHGKPSSPALQQSRHPRDMLAQARDLASRGWLAVVVMRRGYGESDGPLPVEVSCAKPSLIEAFAADADDLQATLELVRQRPDADPNRMMAVGDSAGGVAVAALAARNPRGLLAAVSISSALQSDRCRLDDALVEAFKSYGAQSRVPSLWIYAKNDQLIGPDLVERLHAAFLAGGGNVKLVMLNPIGENGHDIFTSFNGRLNWLPQLDAFLRDRQLPTWDLADVDTVLNKLKLKDRQRRAFVETYLSAPLDKALAESPVTGAVGLGVAATPARAREVALQYCVNDQMKRKSDPANNPSKTPQAQNESCSIAMERNRWIR
jgi:dienelactone hydrolase